MLYTYSIGNQPRTRWWCLKCVIVYLARDIPAFVMYCVNGASGSSLLIESVDSMIPGDTHAYYYTWTHTCILLYLETHMHIIIPGDTHAYYYTWRHTSGFLSGGGGGGGAFAPPRLTLAPPWNWQVLCMLRAMPPHQITYCRFAPPWPKS